MTSLSWAELGARALARQFPQNDAVPAPDVATVVRRTGPIQSQTARSPFVAMAARRPGTTRAEVTAAYESLAIVRGSVVRGTVHTAAPEHHVVLEAGTRVGQRRLWDRTLRLQHCSLEQVWDGIEDFAREEWRTTDELSEHLRAWLAEHGEGGARLDTTLARYLGFGHGGLVRRPRTGGWDGQGAAEYRTASVLLGDRAERLSDPHVLDDLVRLHLAAHGPASRHDLSWWAGLTLTVVDEVLGRLDLAGPTGLTESTGPEGRRYVDLPGAPGPAERPGVLLLPEFDALMCAYHPTARQRFVRPEHHDLLWNKANGLVSPPLLVDGRVTGSWRTSGSGRKRSLEVTWFAGTRKPRRSELDAPVAALEAVLGLRVSDLTLSRG